ncbi:D-hexose-6-phosphate mutarotase [Chromatocurvus halotolerans]|nr:D-hexose-6-phosphate mutarotase [Chromatocurvus halotolerans]
MMPASITRIEDRPGLPELILRHGDAYLRLSLQGAHITNYSPAGQDNLLWVSNSARYQPGTAIRGGIPLCWPWFGANPDLPVRPQHGFARTRRFEVLSQQVDTQQASVILGLDASSEFPEWDGAARLEVEIRLSGHLWMELRTTNVSDRELAVGVGLHGYFRVADCLAAVLPAVTGLDYQDKTADFARRTQTAPLRIDGEVDRVYIDPPSMIELHDPGHPSRLRIQAWGHTDLVVWNPGPDIARALGDFDDGGYRNMVCLEPALALDRRRRLAAGASFAVGQAISAQKGA